MSRDGTLFQDRSIDVLGIDLDILCIDLDIQLLDLDFIDMLICSMYTS